LILLRRPQMPPGPPDRDLAQQWSWDGERRGVSSNVEAKGAGPGGKHPQQEASIGHVANGQYNHAVSVSMASGPAARGEGGSAAKGEGSALLIDRRSGQTRHRASFIDAELCGDYGSPRAHGGAAEFGELTYSPSSRAPAMRPFSLGSGQTLRELEARLHGVEREARDALARIDDRTHSPVPYRGRPSPHPASVPSRARAGDGQYSPPPSLPSSPGLRTSSPLRGADDAAELLCQQWEAWANEVLRSNDEGGSLPPPPQSPPAMSPIPHVLVRITEAAGSASTVLAREGRDARLLRISVEDMTGKLTQSKSDARHLFDRVSELMQVHSAALRASDLEGRRRAGAMEELSAQNANFEAEVRRLRDRGNELSNALTSEAFERRQLEETVSLPCQGCLELRREIGRLTDEIERAQCALNDVEAHRVLEEQDWNRALDDSEAKRQVIVEALRSVLVRVDAEPVSPAERGNLSMPAGRSRVGIDVVNHVDAEGVRGASRSGKASGLPQGRSEAADQDWAMAQANILSATRDIEAEIAELDMTLHDSRAPTRWDSRSPGAGQVIPECTEGDTGGGSKARSLAASQHGAENATGEKQEIF